MSDLRRLLALATPYRATLALGALLMLCESAAALAIPWVAGLATNAILGGVMALHVVLGMLLAAFAAQALLRFCAAWMVDSAVDRMVADMKVRLYDHLQSLPLAWFQHRRLGDSLALLTSDTYVVAGYLGGTAVALVPLAVTAMGAAVLMFGIRADLAALVLLIVPLALLVFKIAGRRIRPLSAQLQDEEAAAIATAQENLSLLPAIKVFAREPHESERYRAHVRRILQLAGRQRRVHTAFAPLVQFVAGAGVVLLLALTAAEVVGGQLSPAELVAFLLYAQLITRPVAGLADVYGQTQVARGAFGRLDRAMDATPEPAARVGATLPRDARDIEWEGVEFAYEGRPAALDGLDLRIEAGEWVALVGPNGAGKSTLGHLLLRLREPGAGRVAIGGIDIATVSLACLRTHIGVVPQTVMLFNATVGQNIAYGRLDANPQAIEKAAREAGAHDFVMRLPQGYETVIGEHGVRLSGGEQQRLALARALVKDPRILVLDEATAMFDPHAEHEFLVACRAATTGRTVLMITHRPASLGFADRIVHMRDGRVERIEGRAARGLRLVGEA